MTEYTLIEGERLLELKNKNWFEKETIPNGKQKDSYFVPTHRLNKSSNDIIIPKDEFECILSDLLMISLECQRYEDAKRVDQIKNKLLKYLKL